MNWNEDVDYVGGIPAFMAGMATPGAVGRAMIRPGKYLSMWPGGMPATFGDRPGARGGPWGVVESTRVAGTPLREYLGRLGVGLMNDVSFGDGAINGPMFIPRNAKKLFSERYLADHPNGAVLLGFSEKAPESYIRGVTAHELGHVVRLTGRRTPYWAYRLGGWLGMGLASGGLSRMASAKDPSLSEAAGWSAASAAGALPMLNEEIQASRIGSRLVGLRGLRRLAAFRGAPSYMAISAMPLVGYGVRKLVNMIRGRRR